MFAFVLGYGFVGLLDTCASVVCINLFGVILWLDFCGDCRWF